MKHTSLLVTSAVVLAMMVPAVALADASPSPSPTATGRAAARMAQVQTQLMTRIKNAADREIQRRITALNSLLARVQAFKRVSDSEKSSLAATVQTQVSQLTTLKTKIDADTDLTTLRTDVKSMTVAYRIFILVIPQGKILAAADRLTTIASSMADISTKLAARIAAAPAGTDVSALNASLADMNAKIADATTQAANAANAVAGLKPDNGDKTAMQSNDAALKQARADIVAGTHDLTDARHDATDIIKGLHGSAKISPSPTASPSVTP
ncbi:MAG TPA: hypothetical protein VMJ72_00350 [Candidatus Paceibacterota bacterium]|nr:hypothetical protein [Candidatus Paceibacterota bacterium]